MTEIYWLTRLDAVCIVSLTVSLACTIYGTAAIVVSDDSFRDTITRLKWVFVADALAILSLLFVPDTKDALLIYGLGSVKEYVESNDKVKELPDKAIEVLDKYLDNINKDVNKEKQ